MTPFLSNFSIIKEIISNQPFTNGCGVMPDEWITVT